MDKCTFKDNFAGSKGGAVIWNGLRGILKGSTFINNTGYIAGAVYWNQGGPNGTLTNSTFIKNTAYNGGSIMWNVNNGKVNYCNFDNNIANAIGGAIYWSSNGNNGILTNCNFNNNNATQIGGAIYWLGSNGNLFSSTFDNNNAKDNGGAIYFNAAINMVNCDFINSKSEKLNGIYARTTLNINGGNGIVYINPQGTMSGISIVVLNNETYYYPPSTNINFKDNNMQKEMFYQCMNIYSN